MSFLILNQLSRGESGSILVHSQLCLSLEAGCRRVSQCSWKVFFAAQNGTLSFGGRCFIREVQKTGFGSAGSASHSPSWQPAQSDPGSTNPANSHGNLSIPYTILAIPSKYSLSCEKFARFSSAGFKY